MKTIVIGAGPAGLNAAIHASSEYNEVLIIEKNEKAGKKIFITGKGRCNVTNNCSTQEFINNVVSNPRFMYSAINNFSSTDTMNFFESNGCKLVVERGNRVFPESYKAYDITDCLVYECRRKNVKFLFDECVLDIIKKDDKFDVITTHSHQLVDNVVIATGGLAYPATGSTGDGYNFASKLGHTIKECVPALSSLIIANKIPKELVCFTLKNVTLRVKANKFKHEEFGELTFYDRTIEGPIAITTSSLINRFNKNEIEIEIDLKPALDEQTLLSRISRELNNTPNMEVYTLLKNLLPINLINFFLDVTKFDVSGKANSFSNARRLELVNHLKHFKLNYIGLGGFEKSIVTAGGINVKEINPNTMESKLIPGLYFAGEVIDVDCYTGGFNIQAALSTGALAGDSIKNKK